jgi:hypothetical protein
LGDQTSQLGGADPNGKIPLSIDDKGGEIYQMQRTEAWFQGEHWSQRCRHGSRGSMSDMISVLHQSVAINAKGGYC